MMESVMQTVSPSVPLPISNKQVLDLLREHALCAAALGSWAASVTGADVESYSERQQTLRTQYWERAKALGVVADQLAARIAATPHPSAVDIALLTIAARHSREARNALPDALARAAGVKL
jgi:hypothetical protein